MPPEPAPIPLRIGHGFDLHRLEPLEPEGVGRPMILAGVPVRHNLGPVGHSDGDAVLHAVTDAILGALALPDIGELFPDDDPQWDNADSALFLREAARRMTDRGYRIANLDVTLILERPKIKPVKAELRASLARTLGVPIDRVNLKGKTHERLDALGRGEGVAAHAVVLLERSE